MRINNATTLTEYSAVPHTGFSFNGNVNFLDFEAAAEHYNRPSWFEEYCARMQQNEEEPPPFPGYIDPWAAEESGKTEL